ncbi:MAG TPA: ABC transporter ATP-binding protein [Acidimicrobiales bacterium]|nr:ABC transporter ATP-binding protein [Acidimicrobiales bacterium]
MRVELRGITKRFPGVVACHGVDLTVESGEVHALLGENGAGKSTLVNVLFGLYRPDEGEVRLDGRPLVARSPADAIAAGVGMVHQHFMLVPVFTVAENVMLGVEPTGRLGALDRDAARRRVAEVAERFGLEVDPDATVEELPVGVQQRVEILKALVRGARCLVLDEPTAVLTPAEVDDLVAVVRQLAADGRSVVFISHKLREVRSVADRITVLRGGQVVGTTTPGESDDRALAAMMVGRELQLVVDVPPATPGPPVLEVRDLVVDDDRGVRAVDRVSLDVRAGEIVAVAGVQGNGQTELVEAVCGLRSPRAGTVALEGADVTGQGPRRVLRTGLAHVPEDRQRDGLVGTFPVADNLVLDQIDRRPFSRHGRIDRGAVRRHAIRLVEDLDVRTPSVDAPASTLSGGNQQKLVIARELFRAERLLVLAHPTRGLDVGSIQQVHRRLVATRDRGVGVLLTSSDLDEVLALADRVVVLYRGRVAGVVDRADADRELVGLLMAGGTAEPGGVAVPGRDGEVRAR